LEFLSSLDTSVSLLRSKSHVIQESDEVESVASPADLSSVTQSIGRSVRIQVDDCLWLDNLKQEYAELEQMRLSAGVGNDRCVVCTLPYGTCKHTQDWREDRIDDTKDVVDREVEELMSFVGGSVQVETAPDDEDVDLTAIRWVHLEPAMSDKIGMHYLSVYDPHPRGWHTCTHLGHYVLIFGGFRYKKDAVPQPFGPATVKEDVEYLSDLAIFDTIGRSWHASPKRDCSPGCRYGHIAAALDDDRMLIYGGRSSGGRFLSDTWIYSLSADEWTPVQPDSASPPPSPRVFSSATSHAGKVWLFGGTDGVDNFGDLWSFYGDDSQLRWERTVAVGIPPSPRYGHKIILVHEGRNTNSETNVAHSHMALAAHGRLAVVGGCTVSPQSEVVGTAMTSTETKMILDLGNSLQNNYLAEGLTAHLGGSHLEASADFAPGAGGVKSLYRTAASVTGQLHELEVQSREAEKNLVTQYHLLQASKNLKMQKAKHPDPLLDVIFLDIRDLTWKPQIYPQISGSIPSSRMHFGCVSLGGHIIVLGGTKPTSLAHSPSEGQYTRILSLDLDSFRWTIRKAVGSVESLDGPLQIAESDILRARRRVAAEQDRGRVLGARNGMTVELAEAQAVLNVCIWRRKMLEQERGSLREPPPPRWGASLDAVGCRAFYFGGWAKDALVPKGETYILDLEHEMERRRREMDEFYLKLERDRKNTENSANLKDMQSAYELRAMMLAEKSNEAKERALMGVQDLLSRIPPLSVPNPVRLVKANEHSMWLEWDRLYTSVTGNPVDPSSVTYSLYMINGYQNLTVEARVLVLPLGAPGSFEPGEDGAGDGNGGDDISVLSEATATGRKHVKGQGQKSGPPSVGSKTGQSTNASSTLRKPKENPYKDYDGPGFPGEITAITANDRFSVSFDDGTFEGNIHRCRIKLERQILPDRLIRYNEDGTIVIPPNPDANNDDDDDDDDEVEANVQLRANKKRREAADAKYGHLYTEFNRESLTIRPEMSWAAQKRIMGKLKAREAQVQRVKNLHSTYKRSSSSSILSRGSAGTTLSSGGMSGSLLLRQQGALEASSDESDEESDSEQVDEGSTLGLEAAMKGIKKHRRLKGRVLEPTVKVPLEYSLLYTGNACSYEATGLVPLEVLRRDPKLTVPVTFVLQVAGIDFPSFEFSQLSPAAVLMTRTMPSQEQLLRGIDSLDGEDEAEFEGMSPRSPSPAEESAVKTKTLAVSRTKKQIITAIISGNKIVQLERQGNHIAGQGEGDYFL